MTASSHRAAVSLPPVFRSVTGAGGPTRSAGFREWPGGTAHLCVLTAPRVRGRGLARQVAAAATAYALASGHLPQWRARPAASRRVARALGFRELGSQLSFLGNQSPTNS